MGEPDKEKCQGAGLRLRGILWMREGAHNGPKDSFALSVWAGRKAGKEHVLDAVIERANGKLAGNTGGD
jgi:hypothetical protein